jgi:hypothetical protein
MPVVVEEVVVAGLAAAEAAAVMTTGLVRVNPLAVEAAPPIPIQAMLPAS